MHPKQQFAAKKTLVLAMASCSLIATIWPAMLAAQTSPASDATQTESRELVDRPADILRAGKIKVDVHDVVLSPRAMELSLKWQKAIQADPTYFSKAVQNAKPGEPVPYDPRCGLTKEEYSELLKLFEPSRRP